MDTLIAHLPQELVGFVLTLAMSLLIGLEREENRDHIFFFGGVRTFPLIGLGGFLLVTTFPDTAIPFSVGLIVLGLLLAVSFHASACEGDAGLTTELAALLTFTIGATAGHGLYWIAIACGVVALILLQEKHRLHGLATRIPRHELATLVRFLLLTGVILPVVPNQPFTAFEINPFKIWLVVVAVSGVSYLSYLLQLRWHRGLILAGILGGAYSSTVTTVVLARRSKNDQRPPIHYAGAITAATGVMYIRLWILIRLFAPALAKELTVVFWVLGVVAVGGGLLMSRARRVDDGGNDQTEPASNPLELSSAFTFAGLFLGILVLTRVVADRFGGIGVLVMAAIMGAADVDPFILGISQYVGHGLDLGTASLAVVVAAATNNVMKGAYAYAFGSREVGLRSMAALTALAVASIIPFVIG